MASSLLALIDDIASILDDVAVLTKVAAQKTSGVLGDDLALNAQQVAGVKADRELPVVWAVAKGSIKNKLILVPAALAISAFVAWAVTPLLMIGGAFLCFEGFEKLVHKFLHSKHEDQASHAALVHALADPQVDLVAMEQDKISGAVRTDFVLSAEIIAITLGTVASATFGTQVAVLSSIALIMTVGVYGIVAGIVKLDDAGLYLSERAGQGSLTGLQRGTGRFILRTAPYLMKTLSVAGTVAMFLVGGGILTHGTPAVQHLFENLSAQIGAAPAIGGFLGALAPHVLDAVLGVIAGGVVLLALTFGTRIRDAMKKASVAGQN